MTELAVWTVTGWVAEGRRHLGKALWWASLCAALLLWAGQGATTAPHPPPPPAVSVVCASHPGGASPSGRCAP